MEEVATFQESTDEANDVYLSKCGDKEAFGRLIRRYQNSMYRVARNILTKPQDMEDAAQNAVIKAFINIKAVKDDCHFKSWLFRVLINECYNILRKRKMEISMDDTELGSHSYEDTYEDFELKRAVDSLEEDLRLVTLLFYYEDMSLKDISKTLNLPEGTVKSRLARAKKKLEKQLHR